MFTGNGPTHTQYDFSVKVLCFCRVESNVLLLYVLVVLQQMSESDDNKNVVFLKVDVDEADVSVHVLLLGQYKLALF